MRYSRKASIQHVIKRSQEEVHMKHSHHEAVVTHDSRKVFTWDSYERRPHEAFETEVCTRCPHERLEAPFRWEEPVVEIKSHEDLKNRKVRVRRLKT